jgi:hypothetical protein
MSDNLNPEPRFLAEQSFLTRISQYDGRAIEDALAPPTLFDDGVTLHGGVVEATFASQDPPLVKRLRGEGVPYLIDPQTVRFTGGRFLQVERLKGLDYAPDAVIGTTFEPSAATELARGVMRFQQDAFATCYLSPGLPFLDRELQSWLRLNDRLLEACCAANGTGEFERRPILAQVVPGRLALKEPKLIVNRLMDYPVDGVYVQAQRLDPIRDSSEKLLLFVEFVMALRQAGFKVIVGRVGAFGLVLQALGVESFDSGLCQAEAFDLASQIRPYSETEQQRQRDGRGGGDRRMYFELLKTTLKGAHARALIEDTKIRGHFTCNHSCCKFRGFEDLPERRRQHYLWARLAEVDELRGKSSGGLKVDLVHEQLRNAREAGALVRRALFSKTARPPQFEHIDRWIGVLAREAELHAVA